MALAVGVGTKDYTHLVAPTHFSQDNRPEVPNTYVTTCRECPAGCGMHVTHANGRVIKCEGNPQWPINAGALCPRGQSALQGLYDPQRLTQVRRYTQPEGPAKAETLGWAKAMAEIGLVLKSVKGRVTVISGLETGALAEVMQAFLAAFNSDRLVFHEAFNYQPLREAHQQLFGQPVVPHYRLEECECVISFGADFLESWLSPVEFGRAYGRMRSLGSGPTGWVTYVGPRLSQTASCADEFILTRSGEDLCVAVALLRSLLRQKLTKNDIALLAPSLESACEKLPMPEGLDQKRIDELARTFATAKASVALAGPVAASGRCSRHTAMAAGLLNYACGRIGQTVDFAHPHAISRTASRENFQSVLTRIISSDVLVIANCNPVYTWPSCRHELRRADKIIYLGCDANETSEIADWVLPVDSPLEAWGDYEPYEDFNALVQPTMSRLHDTWLTGDALLALAQAADKPLPLRKTNKPAGNFHDWLRNRWDELGHKAGADAEQFWQDSLRAGGLVAPTGSSTPPVKLVATSLDFRISAEPTTAPASAPVDGPELWLYANSLLHDGRVANRGWIQEIPDPISQIVWGNWIDIHPQRARQLGVRDFDVLELQGPGGQLELPVRLTSQVHPDCVAVMLGQGHTAVGMTTARRGANGFALLMGGRPEGGFGRVAVRKMGQRSQWIATAPTQEQFGRKLLQWDELGAVQSRKEPEEIRLPLPEGYDAKRDLYPKRNYKLHRWAMVVDLNKCIGCGACVAACYAENTIAVMGAVNCADGREMAWLKVVPYRRDEPVAQPPSAVAADDSGRVGRASSASPTTGAPGAGLSESGRALRPASRPTLQELPRVEFPPGAVAAASSGHAPLPRVGFLPLPCQQCDAAPCEPVCPVFAAVHNEEGLNAQVYNRCIGTRYCSNNCPYKVRRFNWFDASWQPPLDWQLNPDVSVRCRGVMEKCTFCIQRIHRVERQAKLEGRAVRDGEVAPACVQTCPAGVYTFGDLLDPNSAVSKLTRNDVRRYQVLGDLNTKPAVTYLRKVIIPPPTGDKA